MTVWLSSEIDTAVKERVATTAERPAIRQNISPDLMAMARDGSRISADTRQILASINQGKGTIWQLVNDPTLYQRAKEIADQAQATVANMRQVSDDARRAIADVRSQTSGPAQ